MTDEDTKPESPNLEGSTLIPILISEAIKMESNSLDIGSELEKARKNAEKHARKQLLTAKANGSFMSGKERNRNEEIIYHSSPAEQLKSNKISRNSLCPCGSGKKFKRCCGAK